jgi:acyl-CoA synthetase (AMP-forming)/AMP-acid ligase II
MNPEIHARAFAAVTAPGSPFEITEAEVHGRPHAVFAHRHKSLREMLAVDSARVAGAGYITADGRTITYADHLALVASTARALRERHGIGPGDRVAVLAATCPEWFVTFWAVTSLGAIVTACNGWWTADELRHAVELTEPALLVGDERCLAKTDAAALGVPILTIEHDFAALTTDAPHAPLPDQPIAEDDPALILFTSGTTGRAKGALISHRGLVGFAQVTRCGGAVRARANALASGAATAPPAAMAQTVSLLTAPIFHVSGLFAGVILGLNTGARLVLRRGRFDPADILRLIEQEQVTAWAPIGGMGPRVIDHPAFATADVSSIRTMGFGGGPTSPAVRDRLQAAFPNAAAALANGYGSSETVAAVTSNAGAEYEQHPTSAGRANPTCEVAILDAFDQPVPDGVEGEIHTRSAYTMLGYWRNPEATAATVKAGGWLATGDIGRLEDGRLFINSRARDMVLRSGENIYPIEIEQRLEAHPAVAEAAIVGVDHPVHGQEVKAVVVLEAGRTATPDELAAFVGATLAGFKVPTVWELRRERLPRNAAGKVLKTVLLGTAAPVSEA